MELDGETLARAQRGEPAAQAAFLRRYHGPLQSLVGRWAPSPSDREDALQDLLVKLLDVLPRFRTDGSASLTTWVFCVAHRELLQTRRKRVLHLVELEPNHHPADPRPPADEVLHRRELTRKLESALAQIPDTHRRVWVLARVHDQPLEAIAEVEGVPLGTVKSRLHRAQALLAVTLGESLDAPSSAGDSRAAR